MNNQPPPWCQSRLTAVPSADDIASQIMKNQQLTRTSLQKARVPQTTTSQKRHKVRPLVTTGKTEVTLRSEPYIFKIGRNPRLLGPWLGSFSVSKGRDQHDNYGLNLPPLMQGVHRWIHRRHLRIYLRPDLEASPGYPEPSSKEPVTIQASGQGE